MSALSPILSQVDVIIPTHNGMPYLLEAIESVLGQTHRSLRVLVVDDGSTDDTANAMATIGDERVVYLRKPNGGPSSARNFGFSKSSAPYVAYLDADDLWYPDKLEEQLTLFERNPKLGLVYGHQRWIGVGGEITGELLAAKRGQVFDDLLTGNIITGSASMVLVPRAVLQKVGKWREDIWIGEDWELWLRIAHSYEVDFVPKHLAAVRMVASSAQQNYLKVAREMERFLPIVLGEFKLTLRQRRLLIGICSWIAGVHFYKGGQVRQARRAMRRYFGAEPGALLRYQQWDMYARFFLDHQFLHWVFGTKAEPSWVRLMLQGTKRATKGRGRA